MKKQLLRSALKITLSALLIFSIFCTMFSVIAVTDITMDKPFLSYNAVDDIAQAQTDSTYSLAYDDILAQETAAAEAYAYSYDSVTAVQDGITATQLLATDTWHFGRQNVVLDETAGLYLPDGEVSDQSISKQSGWYSSSEAVRNANTGMLYVWDSGEGEGLGIYNSKVFTFVGNKTKHASVLTFNAPETGKLHLHPMTASGLGGGSPFYTLQNADEKVGVAIYKNGEKVWPADSDYYTLTDTTRSVTTPDISVEVTAGDKIYYKLIPISEDWGYFTLDPKVTYQRIGEAVEYAWSYSEKSVALDETSGLYLPTGEWTEPELYHVTQVSDRTDMSTSFPNYLTKANKANVGIGTFNSGNDIITFINGSKATGITYTAPKNGTVKIHDEINGLIEGVYWGLSKGGDYKLGLAVYKNEEKIYPADDSFIITTKNITFPAVSNIKVQAGDKLTFAIIPLGGSSYTFAHFAPQVTYQTIGKQTDSVWSYSESATVTENGTGYSVASGEWQDIAVGRGTYPADAEALRGEAYLKNWMYVHGGKNGIGVYNNKIITFMDKNATALTYTAPMSGTVRLYDPNGGSITTAGKGNPFWMLDGETVGITIYKNSEKVWPVDSNYYVLNSATSSVLFPEINISVMASDEIRIAIHPLSGCGWGYMLSGAPQIDYLDMTYSSAAAAVAYQETKALWSTFNDMHWSYEEKAIELTSVDIDGTATDIYMPTGDWYSMSKFEKGNYCDRSDAVRAAIPNMFYYWDGTDIAGSGLASYEGRVVTFVGSANDAAPTLTYTAPLTGSVKISSDDLVGRIDGSTFITLHEGGMVGFAIYKNNEKIWPAEGEIDDFYVFHGQVWDSATQSYTDLGNVNMEMPELDVEVNEGDKIRFMFVALEGVEWGYMALDPHILYTAVDGLGDAVTGIAVDAPAVKKYFAVEDYDFSDMAVSLLKADGTSVALTDKDYILTAPKEIGRNTVTVQYTENGFTYKRSFDVTVLETLYGDLDMSGAVDTGDLANLRKYLLGLDPDIHISVTDVTDDGDINIIDLIRMKKHLADSEVILGPVTD